MVLGRRLAIAALLLCLSAVPWAQAPAPPDSATAAGRVDEYMRAQEKLKQFSGSVLLARGGVPVVSKGYGLANAEWEIPNTPRTRFRIGSITKQFTSMVVMQLQERGKVKVSDSICGYVTPCPDTWKPVTVHHLLTHTSGIPSYTGRPGFAEKMMVPLTAEDIIGGVRGLPLEFVPGSQMRYNNSGYFLLGLIIEKVTGKEYEDVLRAQIFEPLGMADTGYDRTDRIVSRRAAGYSRRGGAIINAPYIDMLQPYAAGALYSTVEDLLKWDQALYGETMLPAAAKAVMYTPVHNNYAYGWSVRPPSPQTFGKQQLAHAGGINGFSSMIIRVPEDRLTAIVLSNLQQAETPRIASDLIAIALGQPYQMPTAAGAQ